MAHDKKIHDEFSKWLQTYWSHAGLQGGCVLQGCWRDHKPARVAIWRTAAGCWVIQVSLSRHYAENIWCWKPKPETCKWRTRLIWEKILFHMSDHSDVNSARKPRTMSHWEMFWLYCCRLTLCRQCRNLELHYCIVLYIASHGLKCGTQLLKVETDKIIRSSIAQDRLDGLALISIENEEVRQLRRTREQICKQ